MSLIHHYTSINTLSLILKYKTIRFNRLDRVDDMSEAESYGDYEMGKFLFVSCWTDSSIESIPLWHIYTNGMRGVRISIDSDWMHYRELEPGPKYNFIQSGKILAPIPFDKFFNDEYFILPNIFQRETLLRKVEYVDDPSIYFERAIHIVKKENGQAEMKLGVNDFAIFKKKVWSFQEEVRFILFILPTIPIPPDGFSNEKYLNELPSFIMNSIISGNGPKLDFFDIDINPNVLDDIEVILGPLCEKGDEIMVDSLLKTYTKNGKLNKSKLTGTIRQPIR